MNVAIHITKEDTKENIQALIETSIIKNRQTKEGVDSFFIVKYQLDDYSNIVSTTVIPNIPQKPVSVEI